MRILFCPAHYIYDDSREGSEFTWAYNIADRVSSRFPESVVVTGRSTVSGKRYRIVQVTPEEARLNLGLIHAFAFNARYTFAAFRALHEGRYDLVHHVLPFAIGKTYNLTLLRHGRRTPFVVGPVQPPLTVGDVDVDPRNLRKYPSRRPTGPRALQRSVATIAHGLVSDVLAPIAFSGLSARTVRRAAAVVAVSEEARSLLLRSGVLPSRVVVIPPGVDTKRFEPAEAGRRGRTRIKLLSVSQLIKRKNVDVVVRAFAQLVQAAPHTTLRIVGDGPERQPLIGLAHALGVQRNVSFAGFVPNARVHREYQGADVFVNASAAESFGTTCLEALASGLPVVSTRVGEFASAVEDHRNGYLLDSPDAEELAKTLGRLVENSTLIRDLSARARGMAEHKFDWDTAIIPKYLDLYERVRRERAG